MVYVCGEIGIWYYARAIMHIFLAIITIITIIFNNIIVFIIIMIIFMAYQLIKQDVSLIHASEVTGNCRKRLFTSSSTILVEIVAGCSDCFRNTTFCTS